MSDSVRPHRWQPTRLPHPWDSPPAGLSSCSGGLRPLVELCVEPAGLCGRCTGVAVPLRVVPSPTHATSTAQNKTQPRQEDTSRLLHSIHAALPCAGVLRRVAALPVLRADRSGAAVTPVPCRESGSDRSVQGQLRSSERGDLDGTRALGATSVPAGYCHPVFQGI